MSESRRRPDHVALSSAPLQLRDGLFAGQSVLVSGGGSGIGRATAYRFARLGARIAICGRNAARLDETANGLRSMGIDVLAIPMTIRDPDEVQRLVERVTQHFGAIDVLVNNAGGQFAQPAIDFSIKGWNAVIDTNLNGTWYMMQATARHWRDSGKEGVIVNVVAGVARGMPGIAHSCAARAGVIYLSRTLAVEWAPLRIRINCVAPGVIASEGLDRYDGLTADAAWGANPQHRWGEPDDVADLCCYLASPGMSFMTGEVITLDGGQQLWGEMWPAGRPSWFGSMPG